MKRFWHKRTPELACFAGEWLALTRSRVKESTYIKYETMLRRHILPRLGGCRPAELSTARVADFAAYLSREKGLAPKTVRDILTCLRGLLGYVAGQLPGQVPPVEVVYPREESGEPRVLSREEQQRLAETLLHEPDPCRLGVLLALLTGLRIGELCALRWDDIDPEAGLLRVRATMQRLRQPGGGTRVVIGPPKSSRSCRCIPLTRQGLAICRRMRPRNGAAFVLTGTEKYMEPRTLQYRFARYTAECGLEGVHFHTLRHSFATRCVEVGFELKTLSEILGHSSTSVTLQRYVHSSLALKRANMHKLEAAGM